MKARHPTRDAGPAPERGLKSGTALAALLALLALVLWTEMAGVDFGRHWDEPQFINSAENSIQTGVLLPIAYNYPSVCYDLYLAGLLPDIARLYLESAADKRQHLLDIVANDAFLLRMRGVFILISYASILWIYLLVWIWRKSWMEALAAAAIFGLSWEFAYHARWAVPDAILAQFSILTLMCVFFFRNAQDAGKKKNWLRLAAAAAGLACGTKYQSGLLLIPIGLAAHEDLKTRNSSPGGWLRAFGGILFIFGAAYLITTPGTLLETSKFLQHINEQRLTYGLHGHYGYTVERGMRHFWLMLVYFSLALFSKYGLIAFFLFLLSMAGLFSLLKEERRTATLFLSFPASYLIFMGFQKVMIVRNYLVVVPFLAILAGRGFCFCRHKLSNRRPWPALLSSLAAISLLINAGWLIHAARSSAKSDKINCIKQLGRFVGRRPGTLFCATARVAQELEFFDKQAHPNLRPVCSAETQAAVFYSSEVKPRTRWTANRFNYTWRWFGPYEVNFNYYPTWAGAERIVVMPARSALKLGLFQSPSAAP